MIGASLMINPTKLIIHTQDLTAKELGEYMLETIRLLHNKEYTQVKNRIGVERVFTGTQKREHIPKHIQRLILSTGYCLFCGSTEKLTIDHIKPVSKGGGNEIENLQCLCFPCNLKKSNK